MLPGTVVECVCDILRLSRIALCPICQVIYAEKDSVGIIRQQDT